MIDRSDNSPSKLRHTGGFVAPPVRRSHRASRSLRSSVFASLLAGLVSACGAAPPERPHWTFDQNGVVSDSDKRAAQLLSLSNNSELDVLEDPQKRATSCIAAIGSLGERLRSAGSLRAEHERAVGVAIDIYRRKALAAGMAPAEVSRAVAESRAEVDDGNQQARMAMACLRQLT